MIEFKQKGDFRKLNNFFERAKESFNISTLDKYGVQGVLALQEATPKRTGKTASSWKYVIENQNGVITIGFTNSNKAEDGTPIAILIQYGHGTGYGTYVQGYDYINPAIKPIFDKIAQEAWKEVTKK